METKRWEKTRQEEINVRLEVAKIEIKIVFFMTFGEY